MFLGNIIRNQALCPAPHTIDRWDEATGENLIEHRCRRRLHGSDGDLSRGGQALAEGKDHAAQPGACHRGVGELRRIAGCRLSGAAF